MFGSCLKERTGNVCFMKNLAIHQDLRPEVWEHDCLQLLRAIFVWFMEKEGLATGGTNCGKQMHGITSLHAKFLGSCSVFNVSDVDAR